MKLCNAVYDTILEAYKLPEIIDNPTCYIYDLNVIKENIELIKMFSPSQLSLYYAMKANNRLKIMKYITQQDYVKGVEIASKGELEQALNFVKADDIIFTGPGKTEKELELSIKSNIRLINIESVLEAVRINCIAEQLDIKKVDVLIRINVNHHIDGAQEYMAGISSKMGIDEDDFIDSYRLISALERIQVKGIHVFSASGVMDYKNLIKAANYIFNMVFSFEKKNIPIDIINFGGGIGIDYTGNNELFNIKKYFGELKQLITDYSFTSKELIMELGTYIVGNAGYYTAKVIDIKEVKGHKHVIIAGGINHMGLPFEMKRKHPLHIIPMEIPMLYDSQPFVFNEIVDISGPLCMVSDKLSWDEYIGRLDVGDIVVYRQAGAYCYEMGMLDFLCHPHPNVVFIGDRGDKQ